MLPRCRRFVVVLAGCAIACGVECRADDLVFTGALKRLGHESIAVKLADQRVIEARLPGSFSLPEYGLGDQVQITCKQIPKVWDADASSYQFLEMTQVKLLHHATSEEATASSGAATAVSAGTDDSPSRQKLEHAREVNLDRFASMPNFVADEFAKRFTSDSKSPKWRPLDAIVSEVTFRGNEERRDKIRRDGRPWDKPFLGLPGFKWSGGFGAELRPLFDVQCPTTFEAQGHAEVRGRQVLKFRFSSPVDGCFVSFYLEYQRYNPARSGHVFIDESTGNVIQIEEDASGFPPGFEFVRRTKDVMWDYVKIGEASHLLPISATYEVFYSSGQRWRIEIEYKNHRHFESASSVTFH